MSSSSKLVIFCPAQDFPYNFEEEVEHHNIWSTIPLAEADILKVQHSPPETQSPY
jgi:hypothetical protein